MEVVVLLGVSTRAHVAVTATDVLLVVVVWRDDERVMWRRKRDARRPQANQLGAATSRETTGSSQIWRETSLAYGLVSCTFTQRNTLWPSSLDYASAKRGFADA